MTFQETAHGPHNKFSNAALMAPHPAEEDMKASIHTSQGESPTLGGWSAMSCPVGPS